MPPNAPADLRLIDAVAPANLASWYLRHFTCDVGPDLRSGRRQALLAARLAALPAERSAQFATADRILTELVPFIPLTAPVRWSLVSPRLTGFRPNPFARHPAGELIAERAHDADRPAEFERLAARLPVGRDPASVRRRLEAMEGLLERAFTVPGTRCASASIRSSA